MMNIWGFDDVNGDNLGKSGGRSIRCQRTKSDSVRSTSKGEQIQWTSFYTKEKHNSKNIPLTSNIEAIMETENYKSYRR